MKVLTDLNLLHTTIGRTIAAAAMIDDILGLFILAIVLAVLESGQLPDLTSLAMLMAKVFLFFAVTIALGVHVYPHMRRGLKAMQIAAIDLSALAAVGLAYGWLAEALGLHWIGGLHGGFVFREIPRWCRRLQRDAVDLRGDGERFVRTTVFVYIGIQVDISSVATTPFFLLALLIVAILGKVIGAGLPGLWSGLSRREALSVGVGLSARGAVELVFISIAFQAGLFTAQTNQNGMSESLYSCPILVGVLTTLAVPLLLPYVVPTQSSDR